MYEKRRRIKRMEKKIWMNCKLMMIIELLVLWNEQREKTKGKIDIIKLVHLMRGIINGNEDETIHFFTALVFHYFCSSNLFLTLQVASVFHLPFRFSYLGIIHTQKMWIAVNYWIIDWVRNNFFLDLQFCAIWKCI